MIAELHDIDILVVGAGPVGCVVAERAATQRDWNTLIVEKRGHIAGNCFDSPHQSGVLIHRYGPHYFRTSDIKIVDYLSAFTDWLPGNYIVKSYVRGELYPFPINLSTLEKFFQKSLTFETAGKLIDDLRDRSIADPQNAEELILSRLGRKLYESFYLGYTLKQWGRHPSELEPFVCARIPIRLDRNASYVREPHRLTPKLGFTRMFEKLVRHPRIQVLLNTDYAAVRERIRPRIATIYTGSLDSYFDSRLGPLEWRSLKFELSSYRTEFKQPCVQINYPNDYEYTRSVEIKHITRQHHPSTVVSYEYPIAGGEPYYPMPTSANRALSEKYRTLAEKEKLTNRVFFAGRLATYRYINTDEAVQSALDTFSELVKLAGDSRPFKAA